MSPGTSESDGPGAVPLRGEVWEAHFPPPIGPHPVVIITSNALIPRLSALTAALVTGTPGPMTTHIPIDTAAGVTKYPESWVNVTDLHAVPQSRLRQRRGRLSPGELETVETCLRDVLVL
ncbi:MAG: type II toxin-antitoxin system PemK/MazF family toxin [Actinobacteria bacterium]|nr:type II toxin-antitoxin system PemK/MazF family toxin [Actinomycetota bacterium]